MFEFISFCKKYHNQIGCRENDCNVNGFIDPPADFFLKKHTLDEEKGFFVGQCNKNKDLLQDFHFLFKDVHL